MPEGARQPSLPRGVTRPAWPSLLRGRQQRLPGERDLLDARLELLHHRRRQRRIEKRSRIFLTVVDRPPQELDQRLALGLVLLISVHEKPSEARDRISLIPWCVRQGDTEIIRHVAGGSGGRRRRAVARRLAELASLILARC